MNLDSSFPPMLPPSTELGALLFAVLPCLQETYRPLASFAYHMTELTKLKNIPSVPPLTGLSGIEALITDKDSMLRSLSFYGRMFRMPLLSTIATILQGMQFYQAYKDILPGLFSGMSGSGGASPDLFSMLGGLSPDLMSSLFSGFAGEFSSHVQEPSSSSTGTSEPAFRTTEPSEDTSAGATEPPGDMPPETPADEPPTQSSDPTGSSPADDLYNSLYAFLTPEQQKIYEQLMHTD